MLGNNCSEINMHGDIGSEIILWLGNICSEKLARKYSGNSYCSGIFRLRLPRMENTGQCAVKCSEE